MFDLIAGQERKGENKGGTEERKRERVTWLETG
jgi:hypothetical protein